MAGVTAKFFAREPEEELGESSKKNCERKAAPKLKGGEDYFWKSVLYKKGRACLFIWGLRSSGTSRCQKIKAIAKKRLPHLTYKTSAPRG